MNNNIFHNYTPHEINLVGIGVIKSEGVIRLVEDRRESKVGWTEDGIYYTSVRYNGIDSNIDFRHSPDVYIVSRPVAEYIGLPNVVSPDKYIRDNTGNIIGCEGLCWFPKFD